MITLANFLVDVQPKTADMSDYGIITRPFYPETRGIKFGRPYSNYHEELGLLRKLDLPNIPRGLDIGCDKGISYLVMNHFYGQKMHDCYSYDANKMISEQDIPLFLDHLEKITHVFEYLENQEIKPSFQLRHIIISPENQVCVIDIGNCSQELCDYNDRGALFSNAFSRAVSTTHERQGNYISKKQLELLRMFWEMKNNKGSSYQDIRDRIKKHREQVDKTGPCEVFNFLQYRPSFLMKMLNGDSDFDERITDSEIQVREYEVRRDLLEFQKSNPDALWLRYYRKINEETGDMKEYYIDIVDLQWSLNFFDICSFEEAMKNFDRDTFTRFCLPYIPI